jgi:dipeptidyl aminopeptidase/acylaminoacyl peptidase
MCFDYRGWGESESKLLPVGKMPAPDASGEFTMRVKPVRWEMNFADQTADIRSAISYISGESNVDPDRIGIMGSSYGGGLVTWVAANDPRVKCLVAQVPGMASGQQKPGPKRAAFELATKQARGETEPVPMETGKLGGDMARFAQMRRNPAQSIGFSPIESASKINVPTLIVVAEKDELVDNNSNGKAVYDILKAKQTVPVAYHMIKDIGHFDVYSKGLPEASSLELEWYAEHLKIDPAAISQNN